MSEDILAEFLSQSSYEVNLSEAIHTTNLKEIEQKITNKQDIVLYGPPGTSKSYMVDEILNRLSSQIGLSMKIQFHVEYTYDDFIEGLKPKEGETGGFTYEKGSFFKFCESVENEDPHREKIHPFIIDEINRANITAVFGEVMYLMENKDERKLNTARTNIEFSIPNNIIIIGTMNTADRSLSKQFDFALRRRFKFLPVYPNGNTLREIISEKSFDHHLNEIITKEDYIKAFQIMNELITKHPLLGKDLTIGHVLWVPTASGNTVVKNDIGDTFRELILPQISSYCSTNIDTLASIIGPELKNSVLYGKYPENDLILAYINTLSNMNISEDTK